MAGDHGVGNAEEEEEEYIDIYDLEETATSTDKCEEDLDCDQDSNIGNFGAVGLASTDDLHRYPLIRLFREPRYLAVGFTVEITPLNPNGRIGEEKVEHAVRYSTLTASIILHEELKLCYLASTRRKFCSKEQLIMERPSKDYMRKLSNGLDCLITFSEISTESTNQRAQN